MYSATRWLLVITALAHLVMCVSVAAQTPNPALLVLNKDANELAVIDPATSKVKWTAPTGVAPHEITVSTDGKWAFVANYGTFGPNAQPGHTISVIDLQNRKVARTVELPGLLRPHGIEFDDGKVYFSAELSRAIARYDPATNQVDWIMGTGENRTHMVFLTKDRSKIVTSNIESDNLSIFEPSSDPTGWSVTVVPVGKGPEGGSLTPNGKEFWAANSGDGTVSIVDLVTKKVTQTFAVQTKRSNRLQFTPDGKLVLISDLGSGEVVVVDAAARKVVTRVKIGKNAEGILVVPDGTRAFIAAAADDKVAILDLKTLAISGEIPTGKGPDGMAWAVAK
jgi:YVTN family beta-propeller protein